MFLTNSSKCHCSGKKKEEKKSRCNSIVNNLPTRKPDLAIYSQIEEIKNGRIPTWDSPDIITNNWNPFRLKPEAEVKIRNLSSHVPAINAQINYYTSSFGIGTALTLKLSKNIDVPPLSEIKINFPMDQITFNGDPKVGVHIKIEHAKDLNKTNNTGSQVHDGRMTSVAGRQFSIDVPVVNNTSSRKRINLTIPRSELIVSSLSDSFMLDPNEQKNAKLNIQVPISLRGNSSSYITKSVTLIGTLDNGEVIGGATILIRIDN